MSSSAASQEKERAQQMIQNMLCKVSDFSESSGRGSTELSSDPDERDGMPEKLADENEALKKEVQILRHLNAQLLQKAKRETCQELQKSGSKVASQGANHKEIQQLLQNIEEVVRGVEALPMGLTADEDADKRKEVHRGAAPTLYRGEESDEAAVRRMQDDLKPKRPLESLQGLRQIAAPNGDTESGIGKVIGEMTKEVDAILDKFHGDEPVPYSKEDGMIRERIKKFIENPIGEIQSEEEGAAVLGKDLDDQEEKLIMEITAKSQQLLERGAGRGEKEKERNLKVKDLLDYHVKRVRIANSQNRPMEILQAKFLEFEQEAKQDADEYKNLQEYHLDSAKTLRDKMQQLDEIVCQAEKDSRQEERREYLKAGVERLRQTLQQVLQVAQDLSEVCAVLDGKQLAYEEAKKLKEEELPGLEQAEKTHMDAQSRVEDGAKLLADVASCIETAYKGLMEHSKAYMEECERKAPVYGAKCMATQQRLHLIIDEQMEKYEEMLEKTKREYEKRDEELAMVEALDCVTEEDNRNFEEAKAKFEECKRRKEEFEERLQELEEVKNITSLEVLQSAEEAAALADPAMQGGAQTWVAQFLFEPPKRSQRSRLPALTEGEQVRFGTGRGFRQFQDRRSFHLQLEDGQRHLGPSGKASTVDEDAVSVQSSCDYLLLGDTAVGAAEAVKGDLAEPSVQSFAGPVAANREETPPGAARAAEGAPAEALVQSFAGPEEASSEAATVGLSQTVVEEEKPPAGTGEEISSEASYVGTWETSGAVIVQISQDSIAWPDGSCSPVEKETATILATTIEGTWYRAELQQGQLVWSDGDKWTRVVEA